MKPIQKLGTLTLLLLISVKALIIPAIFLDYELRKDFIIANYCVNKDLPELNCDGKCYLAKQLKKAKQDSEKQAENTFLGKVFQLEVTIEIWYCHFEEANFKRIKKAFFPSKLFETIQSSHGIFHPPRLNT